MKKFIGEQISRFFNTGQWALKLVFLVVLTVLAIIGGVTLGCMTGTECDENDSNNIKHLLSLAMSCLLYTSPSPRDRTRSRMPSSA